MQLPFYECFIDQRNLNYTCLDLQHKFKYILSVKLFKKNVFYYLKCVKCKHLIIAFFILVLVLYY